MDSMLREKITDAVYDHPGAPAIIDAVMEAVEGRIRELEAEKDLLRRQLDTARGERPGTWDTWAEHAARARQARGVKP